jgi:hypothetical protein
VQPGILPEALAAAYNEGNPQKHQEIWKSMSQEERDRLTPILLEMGIMKTVNMKIYDDPQFFQKYGDFECDLPAGYLEPGVPAFELEKANIQKVNDCKKKWEEIRRLGPVYWTGVTYLNK